MKNKFPLKRWLCKMAIVFGMFSISFCILLFTNAPAYFDSYVYYENFKGNALLLLILYRAWIYLLFPLLMSIFYKQKNLGFLHRLTENFNVQFTTYGLMTFLYNFFGLDKLLGVDIFGTSDAFMFLASFVLCIIIQKSIPQLVYDNDNEDN